MSGKSRPDSYIRRFRIPYLAHHDDIGVLTKNRAQTIGKGQSGLMIDLYLIDSVKPVLNRVFYGNNILAWCIDFGKC